MRKYYGVRIEDGGHVVEMFATITGEMSDGTKVYTECDSFGDLINIDHQYIRTLSNGWQQFIKL